MSTAKLCAMAIFAVAIAGGQSYDFDSSANASLKGQYFVREVSLGNVSAQGAIGEAVGVVGIATFDGAGNYSFSGQRTDSASQTGPASVSSRGAYAVAANGFLRIASFAGKRAIAFGGVGSVGPSAFTASATENSSPVFDLIVGIPMGSGVSNASLKGSWNAVYLNFPQAAVGQARQAYMPLAADGAGGFGAVTATGSATDNAGLTTQTIPGVTYSLSGTTGTINFNTTAANQLIGGSQSFFVSADGNLLVGGSSGGYDLLLAAPAGSSVSNAAFKGFYYLGGLDADNLAWASHGRSLPDAYYGSANSTGQSSYTSHFRLNSNGYPVEDLTSGWLPSVQSNGNFTPGDGDQYWLSGNGTVLLGVGQGNFYSISVGLQVAAYTPANPASDVFLNPLGIVNAASFAPSTNPVAPQEMVALFGSNMSTGSAVAPGGLPLPTTLANTRVLVNGIAAPLVAVSPTQIVMLMPSHAGPDFTAYAAFEVQNILANCTTAPAGSPCPNSKLVTMYTNYTAPGIFSLVENGMGPAAAENSTYSVIGAANPAKPGDFPMLFATGLGSVTPSLVDGALSGTMEPGGYLQQQFAQCLFRRSRVAEYLVRGRGARVRRRTVSDQRADSRPCLERRRLSGHPHTGRGNRAGNDAYRQSYRRSQNTNWRAGTRAEQSGRCAAGRAPVPVRSHRYIRKLVINEEKSRVVDLKGESFAFFGSEYGYRPGRSGKWRVRFVPKLKIGRPYSPSCARLSGGRKASRCGM